jgi:hypothetical protein
MKETKTNVHLMQQTSYISSMAPRIMLDMLVQREMGVFLAAVNNAMQSEELIPYLDNWPTIRESVVALKLSQPQLQQ